MKADLKQILLQKQIVVAVNGRLVVENGTFIGGRAGEIVLRVGG